jgi:hypothetical protein
MPLARKLGRVQRFSLPAETGLRFKPDGLNPESFYALVYLPPHRFWNAQPRHMLLLTG